MNKVTCTQWYVLCFLSLQFTTQLRMFIPGCSYDSGSYMLATALSTLLGFAAALPSFTLIKREPAALSPDGGMPALRVLYGVTALMYSAFALAQFTVFLHLTLYINTSRILICAVTALAAFTAIINGLGQFSRMGLLFGVYFAVIFVLFSVLFAGNVDLSKIAPPGADGGAAGILAPTAIQLFGLSELALLVWGRQFCDTSRIKPFTVFMLVSAAVVIIANLVFISPLGAGADKFVFPMYNGLQTSGTATLQRPDIVWLTVWALLAVARISLWMFAACDLLTPAKYGKKALPKILAAALVFVASAVLACNTEAFLTLRGLLNIGVLFIPAVIIFPLAGLAAAAIRRKKKCGN